MSLRKIWENRHPAGGVILGIICGYDGYKSFGWFGAVLGVIVGAVGGLLITGLVTVVNQLKRPPEK